MENFVRKPSIKNGVFTPDQPVPSLYSVSETGLIKIVWDREMLVPFDTSKIPKTKYIVLGDDSKT